MYYVFKLSRYVSLVNPYNPLGGASQSTGARLLMERNIKKREWLRNKEGKEMHLGMTYGHFLSKGFIYTEYKIGMFRTLVKLLYRASWLLQVHG